MKWAVQIAEMPCNHRLFGDVLGALSVTMRDDNGTMVLEGHPFEQLTTPADVHAYASRVRDVCIGARAHDPEVDCVFVVGPVIERMPEGDRRHHFLHVSDTLHLHLAGEAVVVHVDGPELTAEERAQRALDEQERAYASLSGKAISRIVSAVNHASALEVQELLRQSLTPLILGHIMEIIQDDLGSGLDALISRKQLTRFDRSINHPDVYGRDARHRISRVEPPPAPMHLGEAQAVVRSVAEQWLAMKARSPLDN